MHVSLLVRRCLVLATALALVGCPANDEAVLSVSAGSLRVGGEVAVTVSASVGTGPGTGTVVLTASLGELGAASLALVDGTARTTLRCPRTTPGCVAGATITLTGTWTGPRGAVTETATVRVVDPVSSDGGADAGRPDAGSPDAGSPDAGPVEPIDPDGGLEVDGGTFLTGAGPLLLGRLGEPRTIGFSPLVAGAPVSLGFDQVPEQVLQYAGRLFYVRRGFLHVWVEDFPDSGVPVVDAGDPDAGEVDGGEVDAGEVDAGEFDAGDPDAGDVDAGPFDAGFGPFPLFDPEGNDLRVASCVGLFGAPDSGYVRVALPTPSGALWLGCSESASGPIALYRKGQRFLSVTNPALQPLAASEQFIFAVEVLRDGGVPLPVVFSATESAVAFPRPDARLYQLGAARPTVNGFDVLSFSPALGECYVGSMDRRGSYVERALLLPAGAPPSGCLDARFDGTRDAVLVLGSLDGGPTDRVYDVPFVRPVMPGRLDAGSADGGSADGGSVDGGLPDAGAASTRFVAGPPSDFLVDPPTLSIDLSRPAHIIPP
ncbi:MAG: hypothetical protein MUC96_07340 [Myxococcaceae bacterium]|jgi:hypothetical protein|nr:hypothetical protein [Myxococcaceae bacterium]